jgi:enoyl-CoA hydratase / 3-hydroxyacyl-CoA dehydrogenase
MSTGTESQPQRRNPKASAAALGTIVDRMGLKTLVESCLVLEEGVASARDIEIGMMMGAGILPGPFSRADEAGLDTILEQLERAERDWGPAFEPPIVLRRLVAQGRLGKKSGQGFFPYPQPDAGEQRETVLVETRGEIAITWLNRPPANPLSPQVVRDLISAWEQVDRKVRALVIASSNIFTFSAGADIKEFTKMTPDAEGAGLVESAHRFMRGMEQSRTVTIAAVNSIAFGGGCELAMACDFRIAAESATFGQPEINLGLIPGFGGTQRLPRLVGESKALEMNLGGDPIDAYEAHRVGLANQVVPDHELFDTALAWARKLAGQAPMAIEEIKKRSLRPDLDEGLATEAEGFARAFGSEDAKEGIGAFLGKRRPEFKGR